MRFQGARPEARLVLLHQDTGHEDGSTYPSLTGKQVVDPAGREASAGLREGGTRPACGGFGRPFGMRPDEKGGFRRKIPCPDDNNIRKDDDAKSAGCFLFPP